MRCDALRFVGPQHLEAGGAAVHEEGLAAAAAELNRMNQYKVGGWQLSKGPWGCIEEVGVPSELMPSSPVPYTLVPSWLVPSIQAQLASRPSAACTQAQRRPLRPGPGFCPTATRRPLFQAPRDKLVCILNCCRVVGNMLHSAPREGDGPGAASRRASLRRVGGTRTAQARVSARMAVA